MRLFLLALLFSTPVFAATKVPLALNWKPDPEFGGFYAASVAGLDKSNGVEFDLQPGGAGTPVVQMVASGKFDFGIASADEVIMARAHGADVVAIFAAFQTNPQAIMAHDERGFKNLGELYAAKGTLALQKGLPYAMYLENRYKGKIGQQIVPYLGGVENFLADKNYSQQCFSTSEPLAAAKKGAKVKTFLVADEGYNPYTTVLIVRGSVLKTKEALVKAVAVAARAGWREYLDRPQKANAVMGKLNPSVSADTFTSSARAQKSLIDAAVIGAMTDTRWKELRQQLVDLKLVSADALKTDVNSYFRSF